MTALFDFEDPIGGVPSESMMRSITNVTMKTTESIFVARMFVPYS